MVSVGLAFQYAPLVTKNCDTGSSCSASDKHLGGELRLHITPEQALSPWISVGAGYEWLSLSETGASSGDGGLNGWDFDFELGGDVRVTSSMTLGPYVGLRLGNYGSASSGSNSADIASANQTTHGWLAFGVRGAFTLSSP